MRKKVTVKGIDVDAWAALKQMRHDEQRLLGAIISEAILEYRDLHYGDEEEIYSEDMV